MTEQEWAECTDPQPMLAFLKGKVSDRKLRLFAIACCRRMWYLLPEWGRRAVGVAERFAEGTADEEELTAARRTLPPTPPRYFGSPLSRQYKIWEAVAEILTPSLMPARVAGFVVEALLREEEPATQCFWLREIIGNPFRPVALDPSWRTPTVTALAAAAYEDRVLPVGTLDNDRLAVLADALEDAGCNDEQLLAHLREPSPHVRGCWVIDLLLGKE